MKCEPGDLSIVRRVSSRVIQRASAKGNDGVISRASIVLLILTSGMVLAVIAMGRTDREPRIKRGPAPSATTPDAPLTVRATGHEFFWRFRFPGPDAKFDTDDDVRVEKEVHLPLGRDVVFLITSDDYVYTLAIPKLGLRQIAVPELTYTMDFHSASPGSFDVIADPLCRVKFFHDESMGRIVVQSASAFEAWYKTVQ
jgi:heme/copper-type cytochrome/quinol oxidase subunit 2